MKKIIIAASLIAFAVCSQAATVKWSVSGCYERGSTTVKAGPSYLAYFIDSTDYAYASAVADLKNGKTSFISTYGQASAYFAEDASTHAGKGSANNTITTTAGNDEKWDGYVVILDADDLSDASYVYITTEVTKTTGKTGGVATLSWMSSAMTGTQTASNWYAIPEPTSGLLLLLGMAGLALKRKRA